MYQRATAPSSVKIREAFDVKAVRTFLCDKQIEHPRGIYCCLE